MKSTGWLWRWFLFVMIGLLAAAWFAPLEKNLGVNIRIVYLHGAWVWAGLGSFAAAGMAGLSGLVLRSERWHRWSKAFGLSALTFWLTYLPMSLWVMQMNWGGLYFDEPRWRIPFTFAITGILLQAGLWLLSKPKFTSLANIVFSASLFWGLYEAENVLHPDSPVFNSPSLTIRIFFGVLVILAFVAASLLAAIIYHMDRKTA